MNKPTNPKGTRDFSPKEVKRREYLKNIIKESAELMGFEPIETPAFEKLETLSNKYGDEGDKLLFKILNNGDKLKKADIDAIIQDKLKKFSESISEKGLRYDLTIPLSRYVAQHQQDITFPFKRYQIQPVWRADRPQKGRYQEFYQCDADIIGAPSLFQEVELLQLYHTVFKRLGANEKVVLKINNRKIINGVCEVLAVENKIGFIRTLDKLDKIGIEGIKREFHSQGLDAEKICSVIILEGNNIERLEKIKKFLISSKEGQEGINELEFILNILGLTDKDLKIEVDMTLARGLDYYTGTIFEVVPTIEDVSGSLVAGGRYDNLASNFGLNASGFGISFGFERLYLLIESLNLFPKELSENLIAKVMFTNFDIPNEKYGVIYEQLAITRAKGIKSIFYPNVTKLNKQLQYANQKKIPYVIIIGEDEFKKDSFVLKNMREGNQSTHSLTKMSNILEDLKIASIFAN